MSYSVMLHYITIYIIATGPQMSNECVVRVLTAAMSDKCLSMVVGFKG